MPRNSSGVYTLPDGYLATTGQTILASQHNPSLEDIATALTGSLPRNGTSGMLAALPMGGFKVTNMADGAAATDGATKGQLDAVTASQVTLTGTQTLTNKTLSGPIIKSATFSDPTDTTKKAQLQLSGLTTATTRTLTVPDASGTIALATTLYGAGYRNLKAQVTSDTQVAVTADMLLVEDANGFIVRLAAVNYTAGLGVAGAGGLDTGAATGSNWYSVWIIYNATTATAAGLLSLSASSPTMPSGYTFKARVGWVRYDATPKLWRTLQYGRRAQIVIGTNPTALPIMISGSSGSVSTPTWTAVSVSSFVPSTASVIEVLLFQDQGNSLNTALMAAPNNADGSYTSSSNPPPMSLQNGANEFMRMGIRSAMVLESTNVYYASNAGSGPGLACCGWEDNI